MNFIDLPRNIFDIIAIVSLIATSIIVIFSKVKENDIQILRASNIDLRAAINDKSTKIDQLEQEIKELSRRLTVIEAKNSDLANLVKDALVIYFQNNPEAAEKIENNL